MVLLWSSGHVVWLWSCGQVVKWSSGQVVKWSCGQVVVWSSGHVVKWSYGGGQLRHIVIMRTRFSPNVSDNIKDAP